MIENVVKLPNQEARLLGGVVGSSSNCTLAVARGCPSEGGGRFLVERMDGHPQAEASQVHVLGFVMLIVEHK
jgi:hypothetical protein